MNAMVGTKQLEELGYLKEAKEYAEIFRNFRKWYGSQKNFEHLESFFWYGCIRLAKKNELTLKAFFALLMEQLQSVSKEADGIRCCVFSVLAAYFFVNYPEVAFQQREKESDFLKGKFWDGDSRISEGKETVGNYTEDVFEDAFFDEVGKEEKTGKRGSDEPRKSTVENEVKNKNFLQGLLLERSRKKQEMEMREKEKIFEEKLLKLNSKQIDFVAEKLQQGYEKDRLILVMEPELETDKMESICRLLDKEHGGEN